MSLDLRARMLLLALLPTTLVAVLLTTVFLLRSIDALEQGLRTRGTAISRHMSTLAEFGIFSGQRDSLGALAVSALGIDADARGAAVVDERGIVLARSGALNEQAWPALARIEGQRLGADVLLFIEPVTRRRVPVDDIYGGIESPPESGPGVVGYVVLEMSLRDASQRVERLIIIGLLIALFGSAIGGWLAYRIARGVTRPLLAASDVVERIGGGDLAARMATGSAGPLKALASGINNMAARIGVSQEELRQRVIEATADLQREKEAAEQATIAKSHFLAAASHDLRQPLHALGLFVAALTRSEVAQREPALVANIRAATDTLQNLLDAILDLSRLDSGNIVPTIDSFALGPLLDRLARDLSLFAEHKGLRLKIRPTRAWVRSDEKLVERILLNLVGNALRYTGTGGVLVSVRRRGDGVLVEVWDTGTGIPEHAREMIFDEYTQLDNPERDRAKGLGLGLAICRRLAELLAVPIGVRSRPQRGSVFWIRLPLAEPAAIGGEAAGGTFAPPADEPGRIAATVLVIDGDALVRAGMDRAITGWGGRVMLAADRDEALRCCRAAGVPDMVICNVDLPGKVSGIDLARELQRELDPAGTWLRVLLVSADWSDAMQAAARAAGFPLLRKPLAPARLRAALRLPL